MKYVSIYHFNTSFIISRGSFADENANQRPKKKLQRSSRVEQQDLEPQMKKDSLKGTMRPLVKTSGCRVARGGVKSKHRGRLSCNNNNLLHRNLSEMYTPLSTCSESNLSEINFW